VRNLIVVALSFVALFNVACSGGTDQPAQGDDGVSVDTTESGNDDGGTSSSASSLSTTCDSEHVGCPCANEGAVFSCGHVKRKVGSYVSCVEQFSTCENGVWSKCGGDQH
jgi:hypothetical protein